MQGFEASIICAKRQKPTEHSSRNLSAHTRVAAPVSAGDCPIRNWCICSLVRVWALGNKAARCFCKLLQHVANGPGCNVVSLVQPSWNCVEVFGQITSCSTHPALSTWLLARSTSGLILFIHSNMVTPDKSSDDEVPQLGLGCMPALQKRMRCRSVLQPGSHKVCFHLQAGLAGLAQRNAKVNTPAQVSRTAVHKACASICISVWPVCNGRQQQEQQGEPAISNL